MDNADDDYDDSEIRAAFKEDFVPPYLEHVQKTIDNRDVTELLYMAFYRGWKSRAQKNI